jgi:hypothetical protein
MEYSEFMEEIKKKLEGNELSKSTIDLYIKNLYRLNGNQPFKNFNFLKDTEEIIKKIEKLKETTQRGYLISCVSILSLYKSEKKYSKIHKFYYDKMISTNNNIKSKPTEDKTEVQKENWISWENVLEKLEELKKEVDKFKDKKIISNSEYNELLSYMVLSLYVYEAPRRNEYKDMNIVKKYKSDMDNKVNYLSLDDDEFIFNNFKTVKTKGQQVIKYNDDLKNIINIYLKFHPILKGKKVNNKTNISFLVFQNGEGFKINSITNILNKVFGKKVGSSMLRHIYLSNKYGDILEEQKKDAELMAHNTQTQKDYIKVDKK